MNDIEVCRGHIFTASRFVTELDPQLRVVRRFPPATGDVPSHKYIALRPDCSGVTLARGWSLKNNVFVLHDLKGRKRGKIKLEKPSKAVLVKTTAIEEQLVVVAESERTIAYYNISGARLRTAAGDCAGAITAADVIGDKDWEIICGHERGFSIHDLSGREIALLKSEPEAFAVVRTPLGKSQIAVQGEISVQILTEDFVPLVSLELPDFDHYARLEAVASNTSDKGVIFATILGGRGGWHRTTVLLHSGDGQLLYHEVLDGDYMRVQPHGPGMFAVFGRGDVITYMLRRAAA